jgi:hypothetical protein
MLFSGLFGRAVANVRCPLTTPQHNFTKTDWCLCLRGIFARLLLCTFLLGVTKIPEHRVSPYWHGTSRDPGSAFEKKDITITVRSDRSKRSSKRKSLFGIGGCFAGFVI